MNFIIGWHLTIFEVFLRSFQQNRWIKSSTLTRCHPLTKKATTSFLTVSLSLSPLPSHPHTNTQFSLFISHFLILSLSFFTLTHTYTHHFPLPLFSHTLFFSLSLPSNLCLCISWSVSILLFFATKLIVALPADSLLWWCQTGFTREGPLPFLGVRQSPPPHFLFPSKC